MEQELVEIIEVDQWIGSSLSNIRELDFDNFNPRQVTGPDIKAIEKISGLCHWWHGKVREIDIPTFGRVWFIKGPDGKMKEFKSNVDSSD